MKKESNDKEREVMISKTLTITRKQATDLEEAADILRSSGLATTQSDLVRLCIDRSLVDVRERLCDIVGIGNREE